MYKKLELLNLSQRISVCLRKKCLKNNDLRAIQMLDENFIDGMIQHDDGFKLLEIFPSSPAYWQKEGKEKRAMIRQLGLPTFFITLSAAATRWGELLKSLKKIADNVDITIEEAENLPFIEKAKLIRNDPITCARYFDHSIRSLLNVIKNKNGNFADNPCIEYYFRIEVQQRGSLHLHGLFWLKDAPQLNDDIRSIQSVVEFIDKYCSTDSDLLSMEFLKDILTHRHTRTCKREICGETVCRFKMPKPAMKETMILYPLDDKLPKDQIEIHRNNFAKIMHFLNNLYSNQSDPRMKYSFDEFLSEIEIN